jgi:hypothetical protein
MLRDQEPIPLPLLGHRVSFHVALGIRLFALVLWVLPVLFISLPVVVPAHAQMNSDQDEDDVPDGTDN